jgi:hypothetical protein
MAVTLPAFMPMDCKVKAGRGHRGFGELNSIFGVAVPPRTPACPVQHLIRPPALPGGAAATGRPSGHLGLSFPIRELSRVTAGKLRPRDIKDGKIHSGFGDQP